MTDQSCRLRRRDENFCELLRLENPEDALAGDASPHFQRIQRSQQYRQRKAVVFVHGMEYDSREEVLRDLVTPFSVASGWLRQCTQPGWDIYVLRWDSRIECSPDGSRPSLRHALQAPQRLRQTWATLVANLKGLEHRAARVAKRIAPLFASLLHQSSAPERFHVVSHSLGALVWSEVLATLADSRQAPNRTGTWWNLQPALPWDAFESGRYRCIPKLYRNGGGSIHVWHSRFDMILATLFPAVTGRFAMGTTGARDSSVHSVDVTPRTAEAHGQTYLFQGRGCFFRRASQDLRRYAKALA